MEVKRKSERGIKNAYNILNSVYAEQAQRVRLSATEKCVSVAVLRPVSATLCVAL
jgi:hypothetical protein